jgi:threonylcarbamoyladenosine tRNA methylthiotransferase MtaB
MKIYLNTVGCRLNQSEIETFGRQFRAEGHTLVENAADADLAVINTCAVTREAAADSRKMIRRAARDGADDVIATGCWVTMDPQGAARLPLGKVVLNPKKDDLVSDLLDIPKETFDLEPVMREPLPGARLRTRAFIKVQDGCDNRCTFCVTTLVRGEGHSHPIEAILADVQAAVDGGVQEVVLTGVHLGSWGQDFDQPEPLPFLIRAILRRTSVPRLRLSSLEPWDLSEDFFQLWGQEPRLCRHLHLPLQSGCDRTLRRMARKTTQRSFRALVHAARAASPDIAITTDLIAGFPGETDEEFADTLAFVREMNFAGAHVFTYSPRPGTAAATMPNPVPKQIRKARNAELRATVDASAAAYRARFVGDTLPVLWESATGLGPDGWQITGLTDNYLRVNAHADQDLWNTITNVEVTGLNGASVYGKIISHAT